MATLASAQLALHLAQPLYVSQFEQVLASHEAIGRLLLACLLGGLVGIEREVMRRAAGVRTNLLICLGCSLFTLLSPILAGDNGSNKGQVAANIVQGIGFLGAGLIIHNRSRVSGFASAASIFVVAAIGMACGAGLYGPAVIATLIVLLAIAAIGVLERGVNLKTFPVLYEARGADEVLMLTSILDAMDKEHQRLSNFDRDCIGAIHRVSFSLNGTRGLHQRLRARLIAEPAIDDLKVFRDPEED